MKGLLFSIIAFISVTVNSQCSDLFFSEYIEGASNDKAIEIYNPTNSAINLSDYVVYRYNNGSLIPTDSLFPAGYIAAGDVYIAGNPSAVVQILDESDTLHTITYFNGDDALSLKKISTGTELDIIGQIGIDPGTNWPVGTGATSEFTLVRMTAISEGNIDWSTNATQWDVYPQNTISSLGFHTIIPCCVNTSFTDIQTACDFYLWIDGNTYNTSNNTATHTIPNAAGCDSTITLDLTLYSSTSATQVENALDTYTWPINGQTYTTGGQYVAVIPNAAGCDSSITLDLTLNYTGIDENEPVNFKFHPNPVKEGLTIKSAQPIEGLYFIINLAGNIVLEGKMEPHSTYIHLGNLKSGSYFIHFSDFSEVLKVMKL